MPRRIDITGYDTRTQKGLYFFPIYEKYFEHLVDQEIKLLELGIYKGQSLLLWRNYFENGLIVGLDIDPVDIDDPSGRIHVYQGYQQGTALLSRIAQERAPDGFDVIIDDCSHIGELTRISFWHLFKNHLKPGGLYVIEDVGTAFMDDWVDGKGYTQPLPSVTTPIALPVKQAHYRWFSTLKPSVRRLVPPGVAQSLSRSSMFMRLYRWASPHRHYKRTIPSHTYGMIGFVKQLVDLCALGKNIKGNSICEVHVFQNIVLVVKSSQWGSVAGSGVNASQLPATCKAITG